MTFSVFSEREVLFKMKMAEDKNRMLTIVSDLTGCRREEMAEWLKERGFDVDKHRCRVAVGTRHY